MNGRRRWISFLLGWHLLVVVSYLLWNRNGLHPVWMGSLLAFSLPTVQFTWNLTVGLLLGPGRKNRRRYWLVLLSTFIPLSAVRILCFLAYHFIGLSAALLCLAICLSVLFLETYAGIFYGLMWHSLYRKL